MATHSPDDTSTIKRQTDFLPLEGAILALTSGMFTFMVLAWLAILALTLVLSLYATVVVLTFIQKSAFLVALAALVITGVSFPFHWRSCQQLPPSLLHPTSTKPKLRLFPWEEATCLVETSERELITLLQEALEQLPRFREVRLSLHKRQLKTTGFRQIGLANLVWPSEVVGIRWVEVPSSGDEENSETKVWSVTLESRVCFLYPSLLDGARNRQNVLHLVQALESQTISSQID